METQAILIKGHVENRDGAWIFVITAFNPPSKLQVFSFLKAIRVSAQKYLDKRGLKRPAVNWVAVREIKRRVKANNS